VPVAPTDTLAFHGATIRSDIGSPNPGSSLTINLLAETGGLTQDTAVSGPVSLTVTPPPGVAAPPNFPGSVTMTGGQATFTVKFATSGYYRLAATGPGGSEGRVTVDVGVNPDTAP
jgi:phospholipase C